MSDQPKKKGLTFKGKAKVEDVKLGELRAPEKRLIPEATLVQQEKEAPQQVAAVPRSILAPGSRLLFGKAKQQPSGLQQPVVQPPPKQQELEQAKPKPKKQVQIISEPQVKFITPVPKTEPLAKTEAEKQEKPVYTPKTFDPAVVALKKEFDSLKEAYGYNEYEEIDLENLHDEERNEDGKQFYFYPEETIDEDFTELNEELNQDFSNEDGNLKLVVEFRSDGILADNTDPIEVAKAMSALYDKFREIEDDETEAALAAIEAAEKSKALLDAKAQRPTPFQTIKKSADLEPLADAILKEEGRLPNEPLEERLEDKYKVEKPKEGYVPINRRNFSHFILEKFAAFKLPELPNIVDPNACQTVLQSDRSQMYLYQQFVKEYLSWQTPYRGILVYHGLGSGKTCTSIAAAEALFATANKRIIVMSPLSLRQNFIGEITTCGFHHYRLKNYWAPHALSDPTVKLFATSVLEIPEQHLAKVKRIWIPDFEKKSNYETLTSGEQGEIREQLKATILYDPKHGYYGRIWFISYNGITGAELLNIACTRNTEFDNAVIIVDEIHNLTRIMQGTIEPYLLGLGKQTDKSKQVEVIGWDKWNPQKCPANWDAFMADAAAKKKNYKRGYLFYRLLIQAQNSKIIGLSGTPLINFPEELGILANILHGYNHIVSGSIIKASVKETGSDAKDQETMKKLRGLLSNHPYIDFYDVKKTQEGIEFRVTFLPEGIRKVSGQIGVERIDPSEPPISFAERLSSLQTAIEGAGLKFRMVGDKEKSKETKLVVNSQPLLPPIGSQFQETFIDSRDLVSVKNNILLIKRLTGLISYYKGSREDLMPKITKDETVRVPMSAYQQVRYSEVRLEEIQIEEEKEKQKKKTGEVEAVGRLAQLFAEVYEIKKLPQSSNYRMASRQICNFAFPADVNRPRPRTKEEKERETGKDQEDIADASRAVETDFGEERENEDKLENAVKEEEQGIAEDEGEVMEEEEDLGDEEQWRKDAEEAGFTEEQIQEYIEEMRELATKGKEKEAKPVSGKEALTAEQRRCRAIKLSTETKYQQQIDRAKECLATTAKASLMMGPKGLGETSPKYQKMLENIRDAPGSSLVYSQFLQMEGIGIFSLAMEANGYDPIEINFSFTTKQVFFSQRTKASLMKGPSPDPKTGIKQPRYITFTGNEPIEVRQFALLLFNGRFSELPKDLSKTLTDAGWSNNNFGDLCRVFCITSAGAEGLSLKNVRAVHIMEPYWNDVRMAQVKGRAVRICSHAELPPAERTVDIYTYVSVFSKESQVAREGTWQIAEKIRNRDSLPKEEATLAKLPIPPAAQQYTLTSDERLWLISTRKKALIDNLQSIMKASAIDCKLNQAENKDVKCSLFEKTGDFMYDPDFAIDLENTELLQVSRPKTTAAVATTTATTVATQPKPSVTAIAEPEKKRFVTKINDVNYRVEGIFDQSGKVITKYKVFKFEDTQYTKQIGEVVAKESKKTPGTYVPDTKTLTLF